MKNIYILTKEGNSFNEKGQRSVHEQIRKAYNEKEDEQFMDNMGDYYNDPKKLVESMEYCVYEGIACYVVISERKYGTWAFGDQHIKDIIKILKDNPDGHSWQLIMDNLCTPIRDEYHRLVAEGLAEPIEGEKY